MRTSFVAASLGLLLAVFACADNDGNDGTAGTGGGGSGGTAGTGGTAGDGIGGTGGDTGPTEFIDDEGLCRSTGDRDLGCPETFDEALALDRCGGPICAGTCGRWLAVEDGCTPSLGCSYDPSTKELVGYIDGSDTHDFCETSSRDLIYGDGHHGCSYSDLAIERNCFNVAGGPH